MSRYTIVVDRLTDWKGPEEGLKLMAADDFLTGGAALPKSSRIVNLCRRYDYLSAGYYCSLLAEARGQIPMPTVADVLILQRKALYTRELPELDETLRRTMKRLNTPPESAFYLVILFGQAEDTRFKRLASQCFDIFRYPILKLRIEQKPTWRITEIMPMGLHQLPDELSAWFQSALRAYTRTRKPLSGGRPPSLYNLAILHDPEETLPPSDKAALDRFIRMGQAMRMDVELITGKDYRRIPEFDALFIRTTTSIDHYTYQFARKAEQEGLAVIDDPTSILRCTNKVFLHELLIRHGIPTPRSESVNRLDFNEEMLPLLEHRLGYPIVLKIPDGSFSRGIRKAENRKELLEYGAELLKHSRLILAQEFVYTTFDWRVGVLKGEPLYVCQYEMSHRHWQIVKHRADGSYQEGGHKSFAVADAPKELVEIATRAAALMGDGLYGVDVKQTERGFLVIEVNDNPNIDHGVEDQILQDQLYRKILEDFIRRIDTAT